MTQAQNVAELSSDVNSSGVLQPAGGGTGQTTAAAAFNALNPMTTTGDIIYESSPTTAARLGIGSTGQVLTIAGGIPSWATPTTTLPAGTVKQVVQAVSTTTYTYSSAQTWTSASSFLSASITPSATSSRILVIIQIGKVHNINGVAIRLTRGGSPIFIGDSAGSRPIGTISNVSGFNGDGNHSDGVNITYVDSPSSTSSTTYSFDSYSEGSGTTAFNRSINDADNTQEYSARTASSIILMEIVG
jgi:hypothetical protein